MSLKTRKSLFPVLLFDFESPTQIGVAHIKGEQYLGSGFFLAMNGFSTFVTARHVIDRALAAHQRIGIGSLHSGGLYWWEFMEIHPDADLAYARFKPGGLPEFVEPLQLSQSSGPLMLGTQVYSFGFPFTSREVDPATNKRIVTVNEFFFSGYVASIFDRERLIPLVERPFGQNYLLNFEVPLGLSGAPLIVLESGDPRVCGLIYGNRSTTFLVDRHEEESSESGKIIRREVAKLYHFGVAGAHFEMIEIPPLETPVKLAVAPPGI